MPFWRVVLRAESGMGFPGRRELYWRRKREKRVPDIGTRDDSGRIDFESHVEIWVTYVSSPSSRDSLPV